MILVDASVWIDHLRSNDSQLVALLNQQQVLGHPFVTGELALGQLKNRPAVLAAMSGLPQAPVAQNIEVMGYIEQQQLYGLELGYIDVHLLASTRLSHNTALWSRDKRLIAAATRLGVAAFSSH